MKVQEILTGFEKVKALYATRDNEYDRINNYFFGRYSDNLASDSTLRDETKYTTIEGEIDIPANLSYLTAIDNTALCTMDPIIEVPVKSEKNVEEKRSARIQKILYATYEHSGGVQLMQDSALYERVYGKSWFGSLPNLKENRVDWLVYSPRYCYPLYQMGSRVLLRKFYVNWMESPESVREKFPDFIGAESEDNDIKMLICYGPDANYTLADGQMVSGIQHNYGFIPFVPVDCNPTLKGKEMGDFHQTVGLTIANKKLQEKAFKWIDENVNSDVMVNTEDELDPPQSIRGRLFWKFGLGSNVAKMIPSTGQMPEVFRMMSDLQATHGALTGTSAARLGQREGMYVSGGGQAALQQPLGNRLDAGMEIKGVRLALLCEYTLRQYEKHFKNIQLDLYGRIGKSYYDLSFKGKEIKGQYRTNIKFLPVILNDASNRTIQGMQLLGSGLVSKYTVTTRYLTDIIDPAYEDAQIKEEKFADAKLQAAVQEILQAQQMKSQADAQALMQPPKPNQVVDQQKQLEKGRTQETADGLFAGISGSPTSAPPPPAGGVVPPPMPPAAGNVMPMGVIPADIGSEVTTIQQVADAIRGINNLRGRVFIVGALAAHQAVAVGEQIELAITNPLDKQTIINALPDLKGRLSFIKAAGVPPEENLDVSVGTDGYDPVGGDQNQSVPPPPQLQPMTGGMQR